MAQTIYVQRNLIRIMDKGLIFTSPKTAKSQRLVDLSPSSVKRLASLKLARKDNLDKLGKDWNEVGLIFCNIDGSPIHPDSVSHVFNRIIKCAGLAPTRFHDLRYSHASLLLRRGVHTRLLAKGLDIAISIPQ